MKLIKDTKIFFGIIGLIIATTIIIIFSYNDRSIVIAVSRGSITTMNIETGEVKTERNWWNNNIRVNDAINAFQVVVGCGDSIPAVHLDASEDAMIAKTTKPQG